MFRRAIFRLALVILKRHGCVAVRRQDLEEHEATIEEIDGDIGVSGFLWDNTATPRKTHLRRRLRNKMLNLMVTLPREYGA